MVKPYVFSILDGDASWMRRRVRTTTPSMAPVVGPVDGAPRVKDTTHDKCVCERCTAALAKRPTVNVTVRPTSELRHDYAQSQAFRRAMVLREMATLGSTLNQSVRLVTEFGLEFLPLHVQLLDQYQSRVAAGRGVTGHDPDMTREIARDAREGAIRARFDHGATDKLPVRDLTERSNPTFYPVKGNGPDTQAGWETAPTWQTVSAASDRARHVGSYTAPVALAEQHDALWTLVALSERVAAKLETLETLADAVRRMELPLTIVDDTGATVQNPYLARTFDALGHTQRKKLAKLLK